VFLCFLLAGNGPLELVRCETGGDASLSLSFFGICFCHETAGGCQSYCAEDAFENGPASGSLQTPDCGCCLDTVVAELDPTLVGKASIDSPARIELAVVPPPQRLIELTSSLPKLSAVPRSASPLCTVLRI
jgi:hypothetical protein